MNLICLGKQDMKKSLVFSSNKILDATKEIFDEEISIKKRQKLYFHYKF